MTMLTYTIALTLLVSVTDATSSCPTKCECKADGIVTCLQTDLPTHLPDETVTFEINYCPTPLTRLQSSDLAVFAKLPKLTTLTVRSCGIETIDNYAFINFRNLVNLDLSDNYIHNLKASDLIGLFNLKKLVLADNKISDIALGTFNTLVSLHELELQNNFVRQLPLGLFTSLTKLTHLSLQQNHIEQVTNDAFLGLSALQFLFLANNAITNVEDKAFNHIPQLTELSLHAVNLSCIPPASFAKCPKLITLSLGSNNSIVTENYFSNLRLTNLETLEIEAGRNLIAAKAFDGLNNLKNLIISGNLIEHGKSDEVFVGVQAITTLFMNDMKLKDVDGFFNKTPNVTFLSLEGNELNDVAGTDFTRLSQLVFVELKNNLLSDIEKVLNGLPKSVLNVGLASNKIQTVPEVLRDTMVTKVVDISDNPLHCNCELKWIHETYTAGIFPGLTCATPRQEKFFSRSLEAFNCSLPAFIRKTFLSFDADKLVLNCSATSDPAPKITWEAKTSGRIMSQKIPSEDRTVFFNSDVLRLTAKDFPEEYECTAENVYGNIKVSFGAGGAKATQKP